MTLASTTTIPGLAPLVAELDRAVAGGGEPAVVAAVKRCLEGRLLEGVALPDSVRAPRPDRYARRLLHRSDAHGYTLLAMVWGPGQGTPLHDHSGMWCVEGVLEGEIEVVQHDLLEEGGGRYRFAPQDLVHACRGDAGSLIPPFEHHTIRNPSAVATAITLHVYGGEMTRCTIFVPEGDGWFRREERELAYT